MEHIGQRARRARHRAGLTGEEAAEALNTHPTVLYGMERGRRTLGRQWIYRMAEVYKCIPGEIDPTIITGDELLLVEKYRQLGPLTRPEAHTALAKLLRSDAQYGTAMPRAVDELLTDMALCLAELDRLMRRPGDPSDN